MLKKSHLGRGIFPNMINSKEFWFSRVSGHPIVPGSRYDFRSRYVGRARPDFEKDINFIGVLTNEENDHLLMMSDGRTSRFYHLRGLEHKTIATAGAIHSFKDGILNLLQHLLETPTAHAKLFYGRAIHFIIEFLETEMVEEELHLHVKTVWTRNIKLDLDFKRPAFPVVKGEIFVRFNDPRVNTDYLPVSLKAHPIAYLIKSQADIIDKIS